MKNFSAALFAEALKMWRSKVTFFTSIGFCIFPLACGLFMIILKNPEAARSLGIVSTKAQLTAGTADWPAFFRLLAESVAAGGAVLFAIVTIWVFGREFSDHTVKEFLALPTSRETIVTAKFVVIAIWSVVMSLIIFGIGLIVGALVVIPDWTNELFQTSFVDIIGAALLTIPLISFVALIASIGRGYLPPFGWIIFTLILANISIVLGWGDWLPWAVPGLFSGAAGPRAELLVLHSYVVLTLASLIGIIATYWWWRNADQTR